MLTRNVLINQTPRVYTFCVESHEMKTIGERIRQAREARGLSGESLADLVGYKHQSAIGNLENRASGNGGNKIGQIADALSVPVEWLLRGPDGAEVPGLGSNHHIDSIQMNHTLINNLQDWRLHASAKSQEVLDQLTMLAQKNMLRDEDWLLIEQMTHRFMRK